MSTATRRAAALLCGALALAVAPSLPSHARETSLIDIDGDGVNDLKLESDWWKNRWEWAGHKQSWVTNLTGQDIEFDWPVGGQSGTVKAGKRVCAEWTSWTMVFLATGEITAKKGANTRTQKSSAFNCVSDTLKDWESSTSSFGTSASIPDSSNPDSTLETTYLVDDVLTLTARSDVFDDGFGGLTYVNTLQSHSSSSIQVHWVAAMNNSNPSGWETVVLPMHTVQSFHETSTGTGGPPDFYGNVLSLEDGDGNQLSIDAPAWVPTNELALLPLIGSDSKSMFYTRDSQVETFEGYANDAALQSVWSASGTASPPLVEEDLDGTDAASNVNNEPPDVGAGSVVVDFGSDQSLRLDLTAGTGGISASGLGLPQTEGVVVWAQIPNDDTQISMDLNGIPSTRTFAVGGTQEPIVLPQVGGFIGFHFVLSDFPGASSTLDSLAVSFTSSSAQTLYIDDIETIASNTNALALPSASAMGLTVLGSLLVGSATWMIARRRRPAVSEHST